jgi:ABC-type glycerol-3-phosphate transport system substrate-binding protein
VKRLLAVVAAVLALAGCAGDGGEKEGPAVALREFLVAVSEGDTEAMSGRMTSQRRPGEVLRALREIVPAGTEIPEADDFLELEEGGWTLAAVALNTRESAFAAPLRLEGDRWKVAPGSAIRVAAGPPEPGGPVGSDGRVGFGAYTDDPDLRATMWIDGAEQALRGAGGPQFTRYWAETAGGLPSGRHLAVALVRADGEAAAIAWTFTSGLAG